MECTKMSLICMDHYFFLMQQNTNYCFIFGKKRKKSLNQVEIGNKQNKSLNILVEIGNNNPFALI